MVRAAELERVIIRESESLKRIDRLDSDCLIGRLRALICSTLPLSAEEREDYMNYYLEEEGELSKQSAWDDVIEAFKAGKKSENSSNLIVLYLLGMTEVNPRNWYFVVRDGTGREKCSSLTIKLSESGETVDVAVANDQGVFKGEKNGFSIARADSLMAGDKIAGGTVVETKKIRGRLKKEKRTSNEDIGSVSGVWLSPIQLSHVWEVSNDVPDVDVDVSPWARNELKRFAAEVFGEQNVVSICNYNRFGIKTGLKDVGRVYGVPYAEVNEITTALDDSADEMTWEEVCEAYPQVVEFAAKHPKVVEMAKRFLGRCKTIGKHASGLSIANVPIREHIPIVVKNNFQMSSFAEGLNKSDLKTFGFVKFDILGLSTLDDIDEASKMVKERYVTVPTTRGPCYVLRTTPVQIQRGGFAVTVQAQELSPGDVILEVSS